MTALELKRLAVLTARELRPQLDEVMTVEAVAKYLGLTTKTVQNKASSGELPCSKRFGRLYFSKQVITDYLLKA